MSNHDEERLPYHVFVLHSPQIWMAANYLQLAHSPILDLPHVEVHVLV